MMTQHAPGKIVCAKLIKLLLAVHQPVDQRGTMNRLPITFAQQRKPQAVRVLPLLLVAVQPHRLIGQLPSRAGDSPGPRCIAMHAFRTDGRGDSWRAAEHRVNDLAFDARAKTQRSQAHPRGRHYLQRVLCPVHHMESLRRVMQCRGFGRRVSAIDVQLRGRQLFANHRPQGGLHPEYGVPVGRMAEVANTEEVRTAFKERRRCGREINHQRTPLQQLARHVELLDQQLYFYFRNHQVQITAINRSDLALGQISVGHKGKLFRQRRCEQLVEIVAVVAGFQTVFEALMPGMPQALQVLGGQHTHGVGAVFFNAPAELLFHHELLEHDDVRRKFAYKGVEAAVVQFNRYFTNAQRRQVFLMLASARRAAEGDVPALLQERPEQLHDIPARC